jgi:hypothetical protein
MTPTELRLFQALRRQPASLDAVMTLLGLPRPASETPEQVELPAKPKRGRPLNSVVREPKKDDDVFITAQRKRRRKE